MLHDLLETMILRETVADVLLRLWPGERKVAALRLAGLTDTEIGEVLGVDHATVHSRMVQAQERIASAVPEAAHLLRGRRRRPGFESQRSTEPSLALFWILSSAAADESESPSPIREFPLPSLGEGEGQGGGEGLFREPGEPVTLQEEKRSSSSRWSPHSPRVGTRRPAQCAGQSCGLAQGTGGPRG